MITLDITNNWDLVDTDNGIEGRLNVMWLTSDGVGISTRDYSHMTMLNMILEKSDITDFWNIDDMKKHNIHDVIQLGERKKDFKDNPKIKKKIHRLDQLSKEIESDMKKYGYNWKPSEGGWIKSGKGK